MRHLRTLTVLVSAFSLSAMTLLTVFDVFMRFVFNDPVFGSGELIQYLLGIVIFAGMFAANSDRGHIRVSFLDPVLQRHAKGLVRIVYDLFTFAGSFAITAILLWRLAELIRYPEETVVLRMPMAAIVGVFATLSALSVIGVVAAKPAPPGETSSHGPKAFE